jgi:PiT family inorganic phosphate transporter
MMIEFLLLAAVFLLSYCNGANDISKGIATLVGSGMAKERSAILWGSMTTTLGAMVAVSLATALVHTFSSGMLTQAISTASFPAAAAAGALGWLIIATRAGLPVSTTHAITGGLIGAGLMQFGAAGVQWSVLITKIGLPLLLSPVASFVLAWLVFPVVRRLLGRAGHYCVCIEVQQLQPVALTGNTVALRSTPSEVLVEKVEYCEQTVRGPLKLNAVDGLHWLSSGLTSFARGLNDTPKIAALLLAVPLGTWSVEGALAFGFVALAMLLGGWRNGRRVLHTMAQKITAMDPLEGLTANLSTAGLIIGGTFFGLPFSTTHVATSAIVGIGAYNRRGTHWHVVRDIVLAWLVTLPTAAVIAALVSLII